MTILDDFTQEERENLFLIEHIRKVYDTQSQDEQALHAIEARLALSPDPSALEGVSRPRRSKQQQAPGWARFPFSLRPKAGAFNLLAASLVVILLTGSFAVILVFLRHHPSANGTSVHGSGTPAVSTPCPQVNSGPRNDWVSGTITRVELHNGMIGAASTVGLIMVKGPKEQYRGLLGEDFTIHILKGAKVLERQECHSVSLSRLKIGQRIQIQFDGFIMQSFPTQIVASQLVIVASGGNGA